MSVASYIEQDLAARIAAGKNLPTDLSLAALSGHYGVSFTPVRVALRNLIDAGYVERQSNGRVAVKVRSGKTRSISERRNIIDEVETHTQWTRRLV